MVGGCDCCKVLVKLTNVLNISFRFGDRRQDNDFLDYDEKDGRKIRQDNFNNFPTKYREDLDRFLPKVEQEQNNKFDIYNNNNNNRGYQNGETFEDNFRYEDSESNEDFARIKSLPLRSGPSEDESDRIRSLPLRSEAAIQSRRPQQSDPLHVVDPYQDGNEDQNEILSRPGVNLTNVLCAAFAPTVLRL